VDEIALREEVREHELAPGDEVTVAGILASGSKS
jgi:hypothetical protein